MLGVREIKLQARTFTILHDHEVSHDTVMRGICDMHMTFWYGGGGLRESDQTPGGGERETAQDQEPRASGTHVCARTRGVFPAVPVCTV